jgi:hypothetical protein
MQEENSNKKNFIKNKNICIESVKASINKEREVSCNGEIQSDGAPGP